MSKEASRAAGESGSQASGDTASFEDTLDVLEERRQTTEAAFRTRLADFRAQIRQLATTAVSALDVAARRARSQEAALRGARQSLAGVVARMSERRPTIPWPNEGGRLRRNLNRFLLWLLRDYLEVVDRRSDATTLRLDELQEGVQNLLEMISALDGAELDGAKLDDAKLDGAELDGEGEVAADEGAVVAGTGETGTADFSGGEILPEVSEVIDAVGSALECAAQTLSAVVEVHEEMLGLVDAKDAEVLQRSVAGPLRRMELVFDEFGRQQEALLAQLVGRRRELDELIEKASGAMDDAGRAAGPVSGD